MHYLVMKIYERTIRLAEGIGNCVMRPTLAFSFSFVIMTMIGDFSIQTILQKSTMVWDIGPCVAMYAFSSPS